MGKSDINKPVGMTRNTGFEFGIRRTFPVTSEKAWQFLLSPEGFPIWLGSAIKVNFKKGSEYQTSEGITGVVKVHNPGVNLRLTWQPDNWPKASTLQVRVIPTGGKATISFHHENLPDSETREKIRLRWEKALSEIEKAIIGV